MVVAFRGRPHVFQFFLPPTGGFSNLLARVVPTPRLLEPELGVENSELGLFWEAVSELGLFWDACSTPASPASGRNVATDRSQEMMTPWDS